MTRSRSARRPIPFALAAAAVVALFPTAASGADRLDPSEVVGPEACARCHDKEYEVWRGTAHARLYASDEPLHRRERSREIAANLGVRLIQHDSLCLSCHFTPTERAGRVTALAGVSCESCHGAARDWIHVHNTFEGRQVRRAEESAEARRRRVERNVSLGMYTPARIYELASRCYGCHVVPEEELVDVGGHSAGGIFDLAERIVAIRHNFVTTGREGNAPLSAELRRKLEVLGPALELEHTLRALAKANDGAGTHAGALVRRAEKARRDLSRIARVVELPEIDRLLAAVEGIRLEAGNPTELAYAIERVAEVAREFSRSHDGSRLAALDAMAPGAGGEGGTAAAGGEDAFAALLEASAPAASAGAAGGAEVDATGAHGPPQASGAGRGASARAAIPSVEGEIRPRIREPLGGADVLGPDACGSCHDHSRQNQWWRGDAHATSARPLLRRLPRAVEIATLYYGRPAADLMVKGGSVCMGCHGTALAGEEVWEVAFGVSCEGCHGPAGTYVRAHQQASPADRRRLGMVDLGEPGVRARVCSSCHYVTDRRLLASGHPPGTDRFDLAARSARIEHWAGAQPSGAALGAAYARALEARGPVPRVRVATLDPAIVRSAAASSSGESSSRGPVVRSGAGGLSGPATGLGAPPIPAIRPATASGDPRPVDLAPWPEDADDLSLHELLLWVEERLDALFEATGGDG